jgi:hypothetical protein
VSQFAIGIIAIALGLLSLNLIFGRKRPAKQEPFKFAEPTPYHEHQEEEHAIPIGGRR